MQKLQLAALRHKNQIMIGLALAIPAAGTAGAQAVAPTTAGQAAVTGLGLNDMITAFGAAIRQLVQDNGTALALVVLPILAWYFIRNQLRGSV